MQKALLIFVTLCFASAASATVVDYGWEDSGTVLNIWPDPALPSIIATNVPAWEDNPVHGGNFSLMLEDNAESGTPQAYLIYLWFIEDGDEITVGFWRYDDSPGASPSVRIWAHWNDELPGNPDGYNGSASGNDDFGPGEGWDYTEWTWTGVDGHTGLVIEARTYSEAGDTIWLDDLHIEAPDNIYIQIPGCSTVGDVEGTWGGVKALYR